MNNFTSTGRLVREPELKKTTNGKSVCPFTLAVERDYTGTDGTKTADFLEYVAYGASADYIAKYFHKGMKLAVSGSVQSRTYNDKEGKSRKIVEIIVGRVESADGKSNGNAPAQHTASNNSFATNDFNGFQPIADDSGDMPF